MASVTVTVDSSSNHLQFEAIPMIDLRLLSQSELNSLSLCSKDAFDLRRCDDVVIPKIDRSVFNESAGSRKQTYSRLRLAPRKPEITSIGRRRRCSSLLSIPKPPLNPVDDPERKENKLIVSLLRELFARGNSGPRHDLTPDERENIQSLTVPVCPIPINNDNGVVVQALPVSVFNGERRKKRGRKRKNEARPPGIQLDDGNMTKAIVVYENGSNVEDTSMGILNRNGVVVDVAALANVDDPFGPELRRRTAGLENEEALLGFLGGLNGQWGSRRKKRKIVDACDFGDHLPKGWKLLLALKRKEGNVWLNCRRYISPNGHLFVSCKEVSMYLLSFSGPLDTRQPISGQSENIHWDYTLVSESSAGFTSKDDNTKKDLLCYPVSPIQSVSNGLEKQVSLLRAGNLEEVQVRDLFQCHKCSMNFNNKDACLQHFVSSHQRSSKRSRLSSSISDGVIIKDGKYECQFCHKTFEERHRYNGHVGVHVRNYVRSTDASPVEVHSQKSINSSFLSGFSSGISKMDALVDVANSSFAEMYTSKPKDELNSLTHSKMDADSIQEISTEKPNLGSSYIEKNLEDDQIKESPVDESHGKENYSYTVEDDKLGKIDNASNIIEYGTALVNEKTRFPEISDGSCGENGSLSPSGNDEVFDGKNNVKKVLTSGIEEPKLDEMVKPSDQTEIGKSGIEQGRGFKKFTPPSAHEEFSDEVRKPVNAEMVVEQERVSERCSITPYDNEKICDVENNVNKVLGCSVVEPKLDEVGKCWNNEVERGYEISSLAPSGDEKIHDVENNLNEVFTCCMEEPKLDEVGKSGNNELEIDFGISHSKGNMDVVTENIEITGKEDLLQCGVSDSSLPLVQSSSTFHAFNILSDKGEDEFYGVSQKLHSLSSFDELRLFDIEPPKLGYMTEQESTSIPQEPIGLTYDAEMEQGLNSSVNFEWEAILPNIVGQHQETTLCVWCRIEFSHEPINPEMQSDSVGFMCPTCKAKISGQLTVLDNGLPETCDRL